MLAHFYAPADWFMVFDMPGYTLQNLLKDSELLPLPSRQIREIIGQIIAALSGIELFNSSLLVGSYSRPF